MTAEFVHLHVHSQYSLLDGAVKVKDLVKRVAAGGMRAVAVTDHGNMFGAITLYKAAKEAGVQAVLGCELEVVGRGGHAVHLPVLAASRDGYKNLVWLVSRAHVEGAPLAMQDLASHARGLVAMTGCMGGLVPQAILEEGEGRGREVLAALRDALEPGSLYVELQDHGLPEQAVYNGILERLARELELPLLATNDVHYPERADAEAHLYLSCIKTGRSYEEAKERHHGSSEMYLKTPGEMAALFAAHPEAVKNSLAVAERCAVKLDLGHPMLPSFQVPAGYDTEGYFRHVAREGLARRFEEFAAQGKSVDQDAYRRRLETELDVISAMKFPGYFLIVWDFIRHAKENGIPVGPGRGSGAGSLVAYAMRITDLDPIPYSLIFERFLNPERISMPDFDVDFCMDRRDQVIAYVQKKYGEASVGQIATFAELKSKSVVKDVARCIGITPVEAQQIANLIPRKTPAETYTIAEALGIEPKLKARYDGEPQIRELLDQGQKLEGLTRHAGKHAAGIVISEGPLWDHVPVFRDHSKAVAGQAGDSGALVTQYNMSDVEAAGLVKFDFLGLKTLTVLDVAVRLVNARPDFEDRAAAKLDLSRIPLADAATFKLLASGETKGVFQLESDGMQRLFQGLKADSFEDIVAAVALYRPGPMGAGMHEDFVKRKHGLSSIVSLHPLIDDIVKPTYGVIVYQEQVMQIAQKLAGYTLGGADLLRRAMGKKKPEEMAKQKSVFVSGALKNGVSQDDAERIFSLLEYFAGYGFNKCVVGETRIVDALTGEVTTVADLFAHPRAFAVHALGTDGKLRPRSVERVLRNGRKAVFELRTAQGKRIVATGNHPFRTLEGWRKLEDLRAGDRIAAPRHTAVASADRWPEHEVIALAGLLSEGNTCHPTCLYFFGNEAALVDDFARAAARFPNSVARVYKRDARRLEVCVSTGQDRRFARGHVPWNARVVGGDAASAVRTLPTRSGMFEWARSLGILGRKATEKTVPPAVFRLCDADVELFVGRLWAGDGFIANQTQAVPFYATSSPALARDVQSLLLRLGIQSGVHAKAFRYRGRAVPGYTVHVVGEGSAETFLERVAPHCVGRGAQVALLRRHLESTERGRTSKDTIPAAVRRIVDEDRRARGWTWRELERLSGFSTKELLGRGSKSNAGFRRATIRGFGETLGSARLVEIGSSDVFWDRVVSIEPQGIEETFDLTVAVDHNFVADGLVVHNSHSAAYALITYQTAWLKAHYPVELLCAILTSDKDRIDKVVRTIADARAMGVTVLPPDVNQSDTDFKVVYTHPAGDRPARRADRIRDALGPQIRFGLGAVRGLGGTALEAVFDARQGGPFRDMFDLAARVDAKRVNKAVFEALVQCGAFDSMLQERGVTRARAFRSIDLALERSRAASRDREAGQTTLFGLFDAAPSRAAAPTAGDYVEAEPWDRREMLVRERQSLGFYVSGHPLERYLGNGRNGELGRTAERGQGVSAGHAPAEAGPAKIGATPIAECAAMDDWAVVKLAGMVEGYRERIFKDGGGKMAFFELEDLTGRVNVKVRSREIEQYGHVLTAGEPVLVEGKVSFPQRGEDEPEEPDAPREPTILLNTVRPLSEAVRADTRSIAIRLRAERTRPAELSRLATVLSSAKGHCPVSLTIRLADGAEAVLALGEGWRVEVVDSLLSGIERIFGEQVAELR
jgi:DNA polymerase-3 subunit alpha